MNEYDLVDCWSQALKPFIISHYILVNMCSITHSVTVAVPWRKDRDFEFPFFEQTRVGSVHPISGAIMLEVPGEVFFCLLYGFCVQKPLHVQYD